MYIYLAEEDDFTNVPRAIFNSLGIVSFAMELELSADTKMAREDPAFVMHNLQKNSFHLQLPGQTPIEELMAKIACKKV